MPTWQFFSAEPLRSCPPQSMAAAAPAAIIRFALDLQRFDNVDLFQRGQYQVRLSVRLPNAAVIESHATAPGSEQPSDGLVMAFKGHVAEMTTHTFPVKYKGQSFRIGASTEGLARLPLENPLVVLQHAQHQHDQQADSAISSWALPHMYATVQADLYFHSTSPAALKKVSTRTVELRPLQPGCAFADTITFSFFYTCSVQFSLLMAVVGLDLPLTHFAATRYLYDHYKHDEADDETITVANNNSSDTDGSGGVDNLSTPRKQPTAPRTPAKLRVFLSPSRHASRRQAAYHADDEGAAGSQGAKVNGNSSPDSIQTLICYFLSVGEFYQSFGQLIHSESDDMAAVLASMRKQLTDAAFRDPSAVDVTSTDCADIAFSILGLASDGLGKLWNISRSLLFRNRASFESLFNSW